MKRKAYQEPAILVADMQHQCNILIVSPPNNKSTNGENFSWSSESDDDED